MCDTNNIQHVEGEDTVHLVQQMMDLQASNNDNTRPEWRTANFPWMDAIMVEAVEAFDSLQWKWWKHGEDDIQNFKMEVIDMWHFLMSWAMVKGIDADELSKVVFGSYVKDGLKYELNVDLAKRAIRSIIAESAQNAQSPAYYSEQQDNGEYKSVMMECKEGDFNKEILIDFCYVVSSTFSSMDEFVKLYIGKNVLNRFRQANGYKDGSYIKMWSLGEVEKEDNHFVHMYLDAVVEIQTVEDLMGKLSDFLDHTYSQQLA